MAITRQAPRVFNTTSTGAIVSGSSGSNYQFDLIPFYLRIENLGTVDLWAKFNSTGVASTQDILIRACEPARVLELRFGAGQSGPSVVSLAATSTAAYGASILALGMP